MVGNGVDPLSHQEQVVGFSLLSQSFDVALSHEELGRKSSLLRLHLRLYHLESLALGLGQGNLLLLMTFGFENLRLALGLSDVDIGHLGGLRLGHCREGAGGERPAETGAEDGEGWTRGEDRDQVYGLS